MIAISYKNHQGFLNLDTQNVTLGCFKYNNICDAISRIDHDTESHSKEIEIIESLLSSLCVVDYI